MPCAADQAPAPRPPYRQVEISTLFAFSAGKGRALLRGRGRLVCDWRGFWLVEPGRAPVKVVHTDPRKERKL